MDGSEKIGRDSIHAPMFHAWRGDTEIKSDDARRAISAAGNQSPSSHAQYVIGPMTAETAAATATRRVLPAR